MINDCHYLNLKCKCYRYLKRVIYLYNCRTAVVRRQHDVAAGGVGVATWMLNLIRYCMQRTVCNSCFFSKYHNEPILLLQHLFPKKELLI
jgi:hypothetical protein